MDPAAEQLVDGPARDLAGDVQSAISTPALAGSEPSIVRSIVTTPCGRRAGSCRRAPGRAAAFTSSHWIAPSRPLFIEISPRPSMPSDVRTRTMPKSLTRAAARSRRPRSSAWSAARGPGTPRWSRSSAPRVAPPAVAHFTVYPSGRYMRARPRPAGGEIGEKLTETVQLVGRNRYVTTASGR